MSHKEFDTTAIAWETYRLMYAENLSKDFLISEAKRKFVLTYFKYNGSSSDKIKFSGDTDFNFTLGFGHSRLASYEKLAKGPYTKKKLDILKGLTYSIVNLSLMPTTGNLQGVKQGIGNDRVDTFIWALDEYYSGNSNLLINHSSFDNMKPLLSYLNIFGSALDYCNAVYHIDESLVKEMVQFGKQALDSEDKLNCFMDLAIKFWHQKQLYLFNKTINEQDCRNAQN